MASRPGVDGLAGPLAGRDLRQIKDPARNGGLDMPALLSHMSEDTLVGWAWAPGGGRTPAPGTQAAFGAVMRAWAEPVHTVRRTSLGGDRT